MTQPSTLLIDDEQSVLDSLQNMFHKNAMGLDSASSWDGGIQLFRVGLHELVIADYNLPGSKHGLLLLNEARAFHPSTEVVLISGWLPKEAGEAAQHAGLIDHFFVKWSGLPDLLLQLARMADERAAAPSDWPTVAGAFLRQQKVKARELDRVDQLLRRHVPNT